jgi:extradiol dioxygenase family protein
MDKYGWTREAVCKWIKTMTGISIATFFTIDNHKKEIKIYIGSTEYELSYSDYRDIPNNHFTYFVNEKMWKTLTEKICNKDFDMVWVINYIWLVMGMMKNATFVLVTPSINYFDYTKGIPLNNGEEYTPMYARELEAIYSFGYRWSSQVIPEQEARRGVLATC